MSSAGNSASDALEAQLLAPPSREEQLLDAMERDVRTEQTHKLEAEVLGL